MTAKLRLLAVLVVAAVAVGLHWPPARTEFTLDARSFVEENASLRGIDTAAGALLRSFPPAENGRALYRPLTNTSHAVEWAWFGAESRGYYAVNALLYGIVVLLLLALLHRFSIGPEAAFGAALLFAVHPVHSEAVDAIAGRSELLSLGLSLGSLLAFDRALFSPADRSARPTLAGPPALLALLLFAAAALSKETGTVTGALLALQLLMAHRSEPGRVPLRRAALDLAPYALIALALLVLRFAVLGRFSPAPSTYSFAFANGFERLATCGALLLEYVRLILWPDLLQIDFYYERTIGVRRSVDARVLAGWALLLGLLTALAAGARRWDRGARDPHSPLAAALLGGAMFLVYLLPVSHLTDIGALMAERFLFAPSAGLALVAGAGLARAARARPAARASLAIALALACLVLGTRSYARALEWRDAEALWSSLTRDLPGDARGWTSLAAVLAADDELDRAEVALARAREIAPDDYGVRLNTAVLAASRGRTQQAERLYREMIDSGGVDQHVWLGLARLSARRGELARALEQAERALEVQPNHAATHALIEDLSSGLERRRAYLDRHLPNLATSTDRMELDSIAGACRAIGDRACEAAARQRARSLAPLRTD